MGFMKGLAGLFTIRNPETKKRIKRFREHRTAWVSLWILTVLYGISLFSELICNSEPLYVRFAGKSYFPIFAYYPEDTFLHNGKQTRPDYKKLKTAPEFSESPSNTMVFPPFAIGPFESAAPGDLASGDKVDLVFSPETRMASVNVRDDYTVSRSSSFGDLVGKDDVDVLDQPVTGFVVLPDKIRMAVDLRFRNQEAPEVECPVSLPGGSQVIVSLNGYTPREEAPKTVRLKFEEKENTARTAWTVSFDREGNIKGNAPLLWLELTREIRDDITGKVKTRFERPVDAMQVVVKGSFYRLDFNREDVRFPYPPTAHHPMGIDEAGRDVFARVLYGLRISLTFGLILVFFSMVLGIAAGAVQGYYGGAVDITGQRLIEIWSALPFLYIMILMGSVFGRSFSLLLFCYGIFNWIGISYYVRAEFFRLRKQAFVEAAQLMGIPSWKIMVRHILPNAMVPVITFFPFSLVGAIGSLAALDYLGFGLPSPTPSWGELLSQAQQYRWAWWLILYPSLALFIVMLLGVFIGEGIRNAYDPKKYARLE
jgi:microcin C transport system permease protein